MNASLERSCRTVAALMPAERTSYLVRSHPMATGTHSSGGGGGVARAWERRELLAAFNVYLRTPFGRLHQRNPDIVALAHALGRTPGSVAMKLCNLAGLDPVQRARGIRGLGNASRADAALFAEFEADWARLALESEAAAETYGLGVGGAGGNKRTAGAAAAGSDTPDRDAGVFDPSGHAGPTEAVRSVKVRRVQTLFRASVLAAYDFTCAVSGLAVPALLQASHIIPWAKDERRRLDPRNGLALSALHDRAFDRGLITFDERLRLVCSKGLRGGSRGAEVGTLHRVALLDVEGCALRTPTRYGPDPVALAYHREHVFVDAGG